MNPCLGRGHDGHVETERAGELAHRGIAELSAIGQDSHSSGTRIRTLESTVRDNVGVRQGTTT